MAEQDSDRDQSSKTEEPTAKRLQEAREKGQVVASREIANLTMILAGTVAVAALAAGGAERLYVAMRAFVERPHSFVLDAPGTGDVLQLVAQDTAIALLPILALFVVAAIGTSIAQHGWVISTEPIKPKWQKISPLAGLKRLFSVRGLAELAKGLVKIAAAGAAAGIAVWPLFMGIESWAALSIEGMLGTTWAGTLRIFIAVAAVTAVIAAADYVHQWFQHQKQLRMTRQEVRDEHRQQEGDPLIRGKIRALRAERAKKRMIQAVKTADVVITNPTHVSVALKYEPAKMAAPRLVAKGVDELALRIREMAKANDVPLVENPPLAQALNAGVDLDQEIPEEHYRAVAQVIGYVMKLKGKRLPA